MSAVFFKSNKCERSKTCNNRHAFWITRSYLQTGDTDTAKLVFHEFCSSPKLHSESFRHAAIQKALHLGNVNGTGICIVENVRYARSTFDAMVTTKLVQASSQMKSWLHFLIFLINQEPILWHCHSQGLGDESLTLFSQAHENKSFVFQGRQNMAKLDTDNHARTNPGCHAVWEKNLSQALQRH